MMANSGTLFLAALIISFLFAFIPFIVSFLLYIMYSDSESQCSLRRQLSNLKLEMAKVNMVSEFAKYAKIQRNVNKLKEELGKQCEQQSSSRLKSRLIVSSFLYSIYFVLTIYMLWNYGSDIVLEIPSSSLFPVNYLVIKVTPDNVEGVGLTTWLLISGTVAKLFSNNLQGWIQTKKHPKISN